MNLKTLKQHLQQEEQAFKKLKHHYLYLRDMSDEEIMVYLNFRSKSEVVAFVGQLQPTQQRGFHDQSDRCRCVDSHGVPKNLYVTEKDAEKVRIHIAHERQITLKSYPCPTVNGWHLTKV